MKKMKIQEVQEITVLKNQISKINLKAIKGGFIVEEEGDGV